MNARSLPAAAATISLRSQRNPRMPLPSDHRRFLLPLLLLLLLAPAAVHAEEDRIPIEAAMREFNARFNMMSKYNRDSDGNGVMDQYDDHVPGEWVQWPSCPAGGAAPPKPKDEFYGKTLSDEFAAQLVQALADAFYNERPQGLGTSPLYAYFIVDEEALASPPAIVRYGSTGHEVPAVHFVKNWGGAVVTSNFRSALSGLEQYLQELNATGQGGNASFTFRNGDTARIGAWLFSYEYHSSLSQLVDASDATGSFFLGLDAETLRSAPNGGSVTEDGIETIFASSPEDPNKDPDFTVPLEYDVEHQVIVDEDNFDLWHRNSVKHPFVVASAYDIIEDEDDGEFSTGTWGASGNWYSTGVTLSHSGITFQVQRGRISADLAFSTGTAVFYAEKVISDFPSSTTEQLKIDEAEAGDLYVSDKLLFQDVASSVKLPDLGPGYFDPSWGGYRYGNHSETAWMNPRYLLRDTPPFDTSADDGECEPVDVELDITWAGLGPDETPGEADEPADDSQAEVVKGVAFPGQCGCPMELKLGWVVESGMEIDEDASLTIRAKRKDGGEINEVVELYVSWQGQSEAVKEPLPHTFTVGGLSQGLAEPIDSVILRFKKIGDFDAIELTFEGPDGDQYEKDLVTLLPGACASCNASCTPEPSASEPGVDVSLGNSSASTSAGTLTFGASSPSGGLSSPSIWSVIGGSGSEVLRGPSGAIRQVHTGRRLVDITADSPGRHTVRSYHASEVGARGQDGFYDIQGQAFASLEIEALGTDAEGAVTRLLASHTDLEAGGTTRWVWDRIEDPQSGSGWGFAAGVDATGSPTSGLSRQRTTWSDPDADGRRTSEAVRLSPDGQTEVARTKKVYERFPWGEERVEEVSGPADAPSTRTYAYYDDAQAGSENYGRLKLAVDDGGLWTRTLYDSDGGVSEEIRPVGDNAYDDQVDIAALRAANVSTAYRRYDAELGDADSEVDGITRIAVTVSGVLERVSYEVGWSQSNPSETADPSVTEVWRIESVTADPESGYGSTTAFLDALLADADHLGHEVTKTQRWAGDQAEAYRVKRRELPDGRVVLYGYPSAGVTVVERGYPDASGDALVHGGRVMTTLSAGGEAVSTLTERIDPDVPGSGGNWFVVSLTKTLQADGFGRPLETGYFYGAEALAESSAAGMGVASYTTSQTYGCCGVETRTDRYGIVTSYTYDALGRTASMTRAAGTSGAVTLHYSYDAAGRTVKVEREAPGMSSPTVDGESDYDLAGRLTVQEDAGGKFTFYTYRDVNADGTTHDPATDDGPFWGRDAGVSAQRVVGPGAGDVDRQPRPDGADDDRFGAHRLVGGCSREHRGVVGGVLADGDGLRLGGPGVRVAELPRPGRADAV